MRALIDRLGQSSALSSDKDALAPEQAVAALRHWFGELGSASPDEFSALADGAAQAATDSLLWVLGPGSIVATRDGQGVLHDIEIVSPEIVSLDGPRNSSTATGSREPERPWCWRTRSN